LVEYVAVRKPEESLVSSGFPSKILPEAATPYINPNAGL
jgi:hypothetical protein